eukprot:gene53771-58588_t
MALPRPAGGLRHSSRSPDAHGTPCAQQHRTRADEAQRL